MPSSFFARFSVSRSTFCGNLGYAGGAVFGYAVGRGGVEACHQGSGGTGVLRALDAGEGAAADGGEQAPAASVVVRVPERAGLGRNQPGGGQAGRGEVGGDGLDVEVDLRPEDAGVQALEHTEQAPVPTHADRVVDQSAVHRERTCPGGQDPTIGQDLLDVHQSSSSSGASSTSTSQGRPASRARPPRVQPKSGAATVEEATTIQMAGGGTWAPSTRPAAQTVTTTPQGGGDGDHP